MNAEYLKTHTTNLNHKETTMRIKLSQSDWEKIGIKMGWMKEAFGGFGTTSDIYEEAYGRALAGEEFYNDKDEDEYSDLTKVDSGSLMPDQNDDGEFSYEFSYLTEGHEDDARMVRLRQMAKSLVEDDDSFKVHAALYWLLSNYHGGQDSPEYAALSSSPYNPGPMEKGPKGSAKFIYSQLEQIFKS